MTKRELIAFEKKVKALWETGKIKAPVHFSGGNEEQLIKIFKEVGEHDYVFCSHRNHYHYLLHGGSPDKLIAELLGRTDAVCFGNCRSMAFTDDTFRFYSSAIVAGLCSVAVGTAWALKERGVKERVWCFVGDGAVDNGHFWESLQYAEGKGLPITFVVEDNNRSTCTGITQRIGQHLRTSAHKMIWYNYTPTYPHVGSGTYVAF